MMIVRTLMERMLRPGGGLTNLLRHHNYFFVHAWQPALAGMPQQMMQDTTNSPSSWLEDALWFAVPKHKVSRSKKRMKTTRRYRIKPKLNIVTCPRTGEETLMHKLPFNWKQYLPKPEED